MEKITRGEKTSTRRPSKPMARMGGVYGLRTGFFEYLPDSIRAIGMFIQPLGETTDEDASKEGSPSLKAFKEEWAGPYGPLGRGAEGLSRRVRVRGSDLTPTSAHMAYR